MTADLTDEAAYPYYNEQPIRFSDQDAMGHVNNVAYAAYVEAGRLGFFVDYLSEHPAEFENYVLAHVSIDYLVEMTFPGVVRIGARLLKVGRKSVTTGYGVFLNGTCHATATSVNVYFDPKTRKSAAPPDAYRAYLLSKLAN